MADSSPDFDFPARHAFLYGGGLMKDLGTFGGTESAGAAINGSGEMTGFAGTAGGSSHAFLYSRGVMKDLGTLGGTESAGRAINGDGEVTGFASTADGSFHVFLYSHGVMTDLGLTTGLGGQHPAINATGHVAGSGLTSAGVPYAFIYTDGTLTDLNTLIPTGSGWTLLSFGTDINDKDQIVGQGILNGESHGFLLTPISRLPRTKDDCKGGGWDNHVHANKPVGWEDLARANGSAFKNQGDCISYVNTGR